MVKGQKGGAGFGSSDYTNYTMDTGVNSGVLQYIYYFFTVLLLGCIILVVVNYTIYPIFRTRPGDKGLVPLPGSDDSTLYWKQSVSILPSVNTPLMNQIENWSMLLDIQLDNPTANTNTPRILFQRGDLMTPFTGRWTDQDTILKLNPNFNLMIYLDQIKNDLFVSTLTVNPNNSADSYIETVDIANIPVRKAIRVGVMLGARVMEVYINGYLVKSKTYTNPLRSVVGQFQPPSDTILSATARVRNFRLWKRPLSPSEFRSYNGAEDFDVKQIADSCVA
jgi:hypothetical protein